MDIYYIVIELQVNNGKPAMLQNVYSDHNQALSKFYTILASAAVSSVELHGAYIIASDVGQEDFKVFDRRVQPE